MRVVDIADEFGLTTAAALDLCTRAGVPAHTGGDELSADQVEAVRAVARSAPPGSTPGAPGWTPPGQRPPMAASPPVVPPPPPPPPLSPTGRPGPPAPPPSGAPVHPGYGPPPGPAAGAPWGPPPGAHPGAQGASWPPPPAPSAGLQIVSTSPGRAVVTIVALVVAVVAVPVLAIVLLGEEDERSPSFEPLDPLTGPGVAEGGDEEDVFALGLGDCLLEPEGEEFDTYIDLPCDEPHDLEVFHVVDHPAGEDEPYPGVDAIVEHADEVCTDAFEDFVSVPWLDSTLDTYHVYPVEAGWDFLGDREIVCAVYDPAGPVEGTLERAAR